MLYHYSSVLETTIIYVSLSIFQSREERIPRIKNETKIIALLKFVSKRSALYEMFLLIVVNPATLNQVILYSDLLYCKTNNLRKNFYLHYILFV